MYASVPEYAVHHGVVLLEAVHVLQAVVAHEGGGGGAAAPVQRLGLGRKEVLRPDDALSVLHEVRHFVAVKSSYSYKAVLKSDFGCLLLFDSSLERLSAVQLQCNCKAVNDSRIVNQGINSNSGF